MRPVKNHRDRAIRGVAYEKMSLVFDMLEVFAVLSFVSCT